MEELVRLNKQTLFIDSIDTGLGASQVRFQFNYNNLLIEHYDSLLP